MDAFRGKTFLALVYAFICFWTNVESTCDGSNPPTLKMVTFDMIPGRWFTQSGIIMFPNNGIPEGQFLSEFNLDFQPYGKLVFNGRTGYKPQKCLYNTLATKNLMNFKPSSYVGFATYLNKDVEVRILDTDFESYILVWMCFQYDVYNPTQCTDWLVDLMTKRVDGFLSKTALWWIELGLKQTICRTDLLPRISDPKRICSACNANGIGSPLYW